MPKIPIVESPSCGCGYCSRDRDRTNDRLIPKAEVQKLLGSVSHMFIERRRDDPSFRFPKPVMLGRRPFWWHGDTVAWAQSPHAREKTTNHWPRSGYAGHAEAGAAL
jgi:predicted DNA-binding transcriptional regulator AlpA